MQSTVATLLLVTATVLLCCVVIDYAVSIFQTALQTDDNPKIQQLKDLENSVLNQTNNMINQTAPQVPSGTPPSTPPP